LWEDEFYEDGQSIADRIIANAMRVTPQVLAALAVEAREVFNLRHVPLLLLEVLSRTGKGDRLVADTVARVVQRASWSRCTTGSAPSACCRRRCARAWRGRSPSSTSTSSPSTIAKAR
jgi:hypothetical protein